MKKKYYKFILISVLVCTVILFVYLINKIYTLTLEDAKKSHQTQQLQMAKVVAEGINYFMEHLVKDMTLLTENPKIRESKYLLLKDFIDHFRLNYDQTIISSIIISDSSSRIIYFTGKAPPGWVAKKLRDLVLQFSFEHPAKRFLASEIFPQTSNKLNSEKSFIILLPVKRFETQKSSGSNLFIAFLVNFDSLIRHFVMPLELSSNEFVWILDGNGRLIYHPKHEEMLFNSIYNEDIKCLVCHGSFNNQKKILSSTIPAFGEHNVIGDEPGKIFAYVPINIENQKWFIAISTVLPDVTAGLKNKFQYFFILGIVILLTFLAAIFLIYYLNLKRMRSEEIRKNLEKIHDYQEQLNHSSRLATIGELVDSVAHEINTPIGIISANTDSILLQKEVGPHEEELEIIKKQTKRVSDYTKTLLNFSRRIAFNPEVIDVKDLINESTYLLQPKFREKNIQVSTRFPAAAVKMTVDRIQLEQVFINIFNNSIDALSANGRIIVEVREINILQKKIHHDQLSQCVVISITDNGTGIKMEDLDRIFDPFFSTKEKNGTGLGLSITKSIVQRHKGKIEVKSEIGQGTTFTLIIPNKLS